jgi:ligand-binding sensor domain-containing protein
MHIFNILLFSTLVVFSNCHGQGQVPTNSETPNSAQSLTHDSIAPIEGEIRGIWQDRKGNMWFASNGNGVFKYDGKSLVHFTEKDGLSSNYVWDVEEGMDGNMWFKTYLRSKGGEIAFCRYDGHSFELIQPNAIAINSGFQGGFLLCEQYFDGQTLSEVQIPKTSPRNNPSGNTFSYDIYASCLDRKGNAWFGTCSAGLCRYDGQSYIWFADQDMCAPIRDIFEDRDGTLWVGNNGGGLFRFDGQRFVSFSKEHNVHNPDFPMNLKSRPGMISRVWKTAQDKQGNIWIATIDNGIWKYDGKNLTNYTTQDGLGTNAIWTLFVDKDDQLWVGSADDGAYRFNGKGFERFGK